ncbi:uncharacterized protein LOC134310310 [Trichomycterus rosablanca]|uniref:uncharacterized protein LOC134310310 n=1 Tax=Trichomycterus rosablanca TaxID=2290929 RepID=UPI002F35FCF0
MSHHKRAASGTQNVLSMLSSHIKVKERPCSADVSVPGCSSMCSFQKVKRLKTIKERNQIRGQSSYRSNHIHQHSKRACKEKCYKGHECQCSHSFTSKKEKPLAKPFCPQKPSIITEGRLTSIRGLFSHEVRSVDIERLVKEKERQKGLVTAGESPCQSPPALLCEKADSDICTSVQENQVLKTARQTDHSQTNLEGSDKKNGKHHSAQAHKPIDKPIESESPPRQKQSETIVLTSSESETIHKSSSRSSQAPQTNQNDHASPKMQNPHRLHGHGQTRQTTTATEMLHSSVQDVLQSDSTSAKGNQRAAVTDESQHRKAEPLPDMEAVGRVAARLCHSLRSFPKRRHRPLLTECKEILFQCLQERHGSQLEHNLRKLRSHVSPEEHRLPLSTKQAWPSSAQSSEDTCTYFNYKTGYDVDHSGNVEFQTGKGSQKNPEGEDFYQNTERKAHCRKRRTHFWGTYTPQDFLQKLSQQQPSPDILRKRNMCSGTVQQSLEFSKAKQHPISPSVSQHPAFPRPQIPKPPSSNWPDFTSDSLFLQQQKQLDGGEPKARHINSLLEQYRNDPDLSFLWSNTRRSPTASPLKEVRDWSPRQQFKSASERPLGASSSASVFFSSEGFRYEPFYRFPHPTISFNSSERSDRSHYTQSDFELRALSSTDLNSPYIPYWP